MPTYVFRCPKGHEFEKFYPTMNDRRRLKCPECGRSAERQVSGGAGLHFKGSGFYITDYKKQSGAPETSSESKADSKADSKPDTKRETPAAVDKPKNKSKDK